MSDDLTPDPGFGNPAGPQFRYPATPPAGSFPPAPPTAPPAPPSWLPADTISGPPSKPARRSRGRAGIAAGLVALVVVAGGVGGLVGAESNGNNNTSSAASATSIGAPPQTISSASGVPKSYATIAAAVLRSWSRSTSAPARRATPAQAW